MHCHAPCELPAVAACAPLRRHARCHAAHRHRTAAAYTPQGSPTDPLRSQPLRGRGHCIMCDEMTVDLVSHSVARESGRDEAWALQRFGELCTLLSCPSEELVRLGRAEQLAALCLLSDGDVARALVALRLALPPSMDAGRLAAAAPELLLHPDAPRAAGVAYKELASLFPPLSARKLPDALLREPRLLADVPAVARALSNLRAANPDALDVAAMLIADPRLLSAADQ